jgi:hypothetical protein
MQTRQNQQPSKLRQPKIHIIQADDDDDEPTKDPQHTHRDMHQKLQHQIQNYSGSTVGTVAPTRAAVPPGVAYTCNASLYTTSFPLTKATLSSQRAPVTKEEVVTSNPAVAEEAAAAACLKGLQMLHRRPAQAPVGLHGEGSEGAACHLSASTVLAELGGVPQGCCRTCCVCCLPEEAIGGRVDHRNVCNHQAFVRQHHQHVVALQGRAPCVTSVILSV